MICMELACLLYLVFAFFSLSLSSSNLQLKCEMFSRKKKLIWFFEDIKRASNERCPYTCAQSSAITSFARRWRYIFLAHHMPHWTNNSKKSVKFFFKNIDFILWVNWVTYLKERLFKMHYFKIFSSLSTVHIKY